MPQTGTYSANLLGAIASNLAGLQGYDVMALELIQNADDAKASSIVFDITDDALIVGNNGEFSYCGELGTSPCPLLSGPEQYACDFHRITNLASGGKARRSDNIGRFGIGFVSTYQLCDHPQILSTGVKVTLLPEQTAYELEDIGETTGTKFVLPWATDADSPLRRELRISAVRPDDLDRAEEDIARILDGTLLFLKNLKSVELRRNGELIRSCKLTRDGDNTVLLEFGPEERLEMWLVVTANAREKAEQLAEAFPQLETDNRRTEITVAFRLGDEPLQQGLFYAFLPTEQPTGLPLHINADFYPEPDRKALILGGGKHQQKWNEMLIHVAAEEIASKLGEFKGDLEAELVWELMQKAWSISQGAPKKWQTFFWEALDAEVNEETEIAWTRNGQWTPIGKTIFPIRELSKGEERFLNDLGLDIANDKIITRGQRVLLKLGTTRLSLKRLASLVESSNLLPDDESGSRVEESVVENIYRPLWRLIEKTAAELAITRRPGEYFDHLPILLTIDQHPVAPVDAYRATTNLSATLSELLPELNLIAPEIYQHPSTAGLVSELSLENLSKVFDSIFKSPDDAEKRLGRDGKKAHTLYRAMADLAEQNSAATVPALLRHLPIFLTGEGYTKAKPVSLPGNFVDPIGFANILKSTALDTVVENFFHHSLEIQRLDIGTYITNVLPRFFEDEIHSDAIPRLLSELANHRSVLDDNNLLNALASLPLIPTQDGGWHKPRDTYYRTEDLVGVLGNNPIYWVDEERLDSSRSIRAFIGQLGVRSKPRASHLADRLLHIAKQSPNEQAQAASERTFYSACSLYDEWNKNRQSELTEFKQRLLGEACLPAHGDQENWHNPSTLYAPYRLEAFSSQAAILPFRKPGKLNTDLLRVLGITIEPETQLVTAHLEHCVETNIKPSKVVYQILNERSGKQEEQAIIAALADEACIYDESRETFLRPNQLFWSAPSLGNRALKVPQTLTEYRRLFDLLGVKDTPTPLDHLAIAADVIDEFGDTGRPLPDVERRVYGKCLEIISDSLDSGNEALEVEIASLEEKPCMPNLDGKLCYPDEIAIRDSDWHESFFEDGLRGLLTDFIHELQPLYRALGISYLSQKVRSVIGQKLGDQRRADIADRFKERAHCITRVLHDRPRDTLSDLYQRLSNVSVVLCDTLDVFFVCELQSPPLESPELPAQAHYEAGENTLYVSTDDIGEFAIPAFNSILHILATSTTGASIPNLVLSCEMVLDAKDLAAAERKLAAAGFPARADVIDGDDELLQGGELGALGTGEEGPEPNIPTTLPEPPHSLTDEGKQPSPKEGNKDGNKPGHLTTKEKGRRPSEPGSGSGSGSGSPKSKANNRQKERGKKRRDRLLSYVAHQEGEESEEQTDPSVRAHNLTVEDRGRAAVVLYEQGRGRDAIPQSQDNPGWDIVSTDNANGAIRYIEVKALDGEWTGTGVGLSRLQFSEAQNYHNDYWLYVVENAGHKDHERIHPIQSPATKVTGFMFDHNWREVAEVEEKDPHAGYQPGVYVDCGVLGIGVIREIKERGRSKQLVLELENGNSKALYLNVTTMKIIDSPEG